VGENSPFIRECCCQGLRKLGIEIDSERNNQPQEGIREISPAGSQVKVLVVPTDEELEIARETKKVLEKGDAPQ
jgi:acetate kinase